MDEELIQGLKERLATTEYFNLTPDDYVNKLTDIYSDQFLEYLEKVYYLAVSEGINHIEALEMIKQLQIKHNQRLDEQFDYFENFLSVVIFHIPKQILLPNNEEINKAMESFSNEENEKVSQKIKELEMSIKQRRVYIKNLRNQIDMMSSMEKVIDCEMINKINQTLK